MAKIKEFEISQKTYKDKEGTTLNEFLMVKELGKGAFGEVWLAENQVPDSNVPKRVALKIPFNPREDILSEGEILTSFDHPKIVKLYRAGRTSEGLIFLVMEYMPSGTLSDILMEKETLTELKAVEVAVQLLHALEYLHGKGCIHRDIKPNNILFDAKGNPRLADFGLSKSLGIETHLSVKGGTGHYMAPEVWQYETRTESDLWSVGVVLYQMATGKLPFEGTSDANLMKNIKDNSPNMPNDLTDEFKGVIRKALEKDVQNRYQSASDMINALESVHNYVNLNEAWMKKYELLTNKDTVLIIVGTWFEMEIDDRYAASLIQAELMRSGQMAQITTDVEYLKHKERVANNPVISVGGPDGNRVTHEFNQTLEIDESLYRSFGQKVVKVNPFPPYKAVVWGGYAQDTMLAVVEFIENDLSHFLKPDVAVDKIILSPHINDAFLSLGGCIINWRRESKTIKILDVFSNTNWSSFYLSSQNPQQVAAISNFRKVEELTNALTVDVRVEFLDFPEVLLRKNLDSMDDPGLIYGDDKINWDLERPLVENIKRLIPIGPDIEYYFPLGLVEHVDHLLMRTIGVELMKEGKIRKSYFYEDICPFTPTIEKELASKDIQGVPSYITEMMGTLDIHVKPHRVEINIKEVLDMVAVYSSETADMREMLFNIKRYSRSKEDGKHYVRYWEVNGG